MTLPYADLVKDTSTAQSSSLITLANAPPSGFQSFNSGIGDTNNAVYRVSDTAGHWEINYGVYSNSALTLARAATPIASSNGASPPTQIAAFSGTVTVACVVPADQFLNAFDLIGANSGLYKNYLVAGVLTGTAQTVGALCLVPVYIKQWFENYFVTVQQTTAAAAGGSVSFGLFNCLPNSAYPNLLLGAGSSGNANTAIGQVQSPSIAVPQPQAPGIYWAAYLPLVAAGSINTCTQATAEVGFAELFGVATPNTAMTAAFYHATGQSGMPGQVPALTAVSGVPPFICVGVN